MLSLCTGAIECCHLIITCNGYQLSDAETSHYKWGGSRGGSYTVLTLYVVQYYKMTLRDKQHVS